MELIQMVISLIVIGVLYARMIGRETPQPIGKAQAIVPVVLGLITVPLSFVITMGIATFMVGAGFTVSSISNTVLRALAGAFFAAGFTEELAKLLLLLVAVAIFKPKNVYEYIIAGAGIGFGFTLLEEFFYGGGLMALTRLLTIALHMLFGIIMGRHLGLARHAKITGDGSATMHYVLAFVMPVLVHTLFDACTGLNPALKAATEGGDDLTLGIGLAVALGMMVVGIVSQFVLLLGLKRDAQQYCEMETR